MSVLDLYNIIFLLSTHFRQFSSITISSVTNPLAVKPLAIRLLAIRLLTIRLLTIKPLMTNDGGRSHDPSSFCPNEAFDQHMSDFY